MLTSEDAPSYLAPYRDAARKHGGGFKSLLWASPQTQEARFDAFLRLIPMRGKNVLDVGCGRADLLDFLISRKHTPAHYVGIEAVNDLALAAENKRRANCMILRADFVRDPIKMFVAADVVTISGALNTVDRATFYQTLRTAWEAAAESLVFNFLDSPDLAASSFLTWHDRADVLTFARTLDPDARINHDYLDGDCTIAVTKANELK